MPAGEPLHRSSIPGNRRRVGEILTAAENTTTEIAHRGGGFSCYQPVGSFDPMNERLSRPVLAVPALLETAVG
jgi:hypothetical protein